MGHAHGSGITSVHYLISNLARQAGHNVTSIVLQASEKEQRDAQKRNITLLLPKLRTSLQHDIHMTMLHPMTYFPLLRDISADVIVGHVPMTSESAIFVRDEVFPHAQVILFNHVIPEDTEIYKDNWTPALIEDKETEIRLQAEQADIVFSVGPRVFNHFDNKFLASTYIDHRLFLPVPAKDFFDIDPMRPEPNHVRRILTIGRVIGVKHLKGYDVIAMALSQVAEVFHKMNKIPPTWTIRGIPFGEHQQTKEHIFEHVMSAYLKVNLYPYGSHDQIRTDLRQSHLVIVASRSEPFGMAGLEALAAGIPVLVTIHSGLAQFLNENIPDEASQLIVNVGLNNVSLERDVDTWTKYILDVLINYDVAFDRARKLKYRLLTLKSIYNSHKDFQDSCRVNIH
ncbi:uncharacterized protein LOC144355292 [Saccoglossus kowalevskii]